MRQLGGITQWRWVWVNSGSWWWTGRPGILWSMGSQRVRHDWGTELNWTELYELPHKPIRKCPLLSYSLKTLANNWYCLKLPSPPPSPEACSNSRPSSRWCHPIISFSVVLFSSCLQSSPAPGSFQMSQLFTSGGQCIGASASASVLPMNIQDWFPLGWTGWIFLQSKGLSRVFSNTTVQKHQFFGAQPSSQSNSHIHTWPLEKP